MIDRDTLNHVNPTDVGHATMALADRLQDIPREVGLVGIAALFLFVCEHLRAQPQDVFTVTKNMLAESLDGVNPELTAARLYVENEI